MSVKAHLVLDLDEDLRTFNIECSGSKLGQLYCLARGAAHLLHCYQESNRIAIVAAIAEQTLEVLAEMEDDDSTGEEQSND